MRRHSLAFVVVAMSVAASADAAAQRPHVLTHADTLRGSNGPARAWWDASFYDLHVTVSPNDSSIRGYNAITYRVLRPATEMQIDLQVPLEVDSMVQDTRHVTYRRDGNAFFVSLTATQPAGAKKTISVYYHGKPVAAKRPPWDGGFIWQHDSLGNPWVATADEGLGASVWWPNKDILSDEPDSQRVAITMPDPMVDVSNGRLRRTTHNTDGTSTYEWFVTEPINNYSIEVNAGQYAHFGETFMGEAGKLSMDFWPLSYHADTAKAQFRQAKPMMTCFEHWFGPYPWYKDGYKLIEAPHLGMEHQSGVAYGNKYKNGYSGRDLSGTGWGMKWDFIIVHESAHEWWGNNITAKDQADMWIHESFANYAEGLYAECEDGKQAGAEYIIGSRRNIQNDAPIIAAYGVNADGSGDMYYKGGSMLHMMRQIVGNDDQWRGMLRGVNKTFWHQTVTSAQIETYISKQLGVDFSKVFEQYLTTTKIPVLEFKIENDRLYYHWTNVVPGFAMPVKASVGTSAGVAWLRPTEAWKALPATVAKTDSLTIDPNFYVRAKRAAPIGEALWYSVGSEQSTQSFLAHAGQISIISPQVFMMDSTGTIGGSMDARVVAAARANGVKVVPLVMNPGFDQPTIHRVITVAGVKRVAIDNLVKLCRDNHFDGIQFDIENVHISDKAALTSFMSESAVALHAIGCSVSAAVVPRTSEDPGPTSYHRWIYENWRGVYDYKALAEALDFISYMTYAQHTGGSTPGPVAGYSWMKESLDYVLSLGVPPGKISLGIPAYSDWWYPAYDAKTGARMRGGDISFATADSLLKTNRAKPTWDDAERSPYAFWSHAGVYEHLWIEDARAFTAKLELVQKYTLRGYSVWVLGLEDPAVWPAIRDARPH
ncbi:MAG TPA: glycosyl hydrolase family 18 protein [Gemmatimonadaceae bacterium]|nr:glycosyl hydrolase family 18 protein [Gemmatimonadaceae bacterium]